MSLLPKTLKLFVKLLNSRPKYIHSYILIRHPQKKVFFIQAFNHNLVLPVRHVLCTFFLPATKYPYHLLLKQFFCSDNNPWLFLAAMPLSKAPMPSLGSVAANFPLLQLCVCAHTVEVCMSLTHGCQVLQISLRDQNGLHTNILNFNQ